MENKEVKVMNLYVVQDVLVDYTAGMVVLAADSLERARELFKAEFTYEEYVKGFDEAVQNGQYKVLKVVDQEEGLVDYVWGGG
jgi:hypothetical protein